MARAALLRVMAGSTSESIYLLRRLSDFVDSLNGLREETGQGISALDLEQMLRLPEADYVSIDDDWRHRRWLREHGFDVIVKGALRLAAHKVLNEKPQFGGKYSEEVIEHGIQTLEELKRSPPKLASASRRSDLAGRQPEVDLGPSKEEIVGAAPRRAKIDRGFSQQDLKELRKAIKTNDKKRIAELTAKLGRPSNND